MRQYVVLDRGTRHPYYHVRYLLLAAALHGCGGAPASIAPKGLSPTDRATVAGWIAPYALRERRRHDLRWRFVNDRGASGGRASVRLVPPDSMRFDYRGPFGRSGAAVLVGDSAHWARPETDLRQVVLTAPLFWAAIGIPRMPPDGSAIEGLATEGRRAWRYVVESDTFDIIEVRGTRLRLLAEMRRGGRIVVATETRLDPDTRRPIEARMTFPLDVARFSFTVTASDTTVETDPSIWIQP